MLSVLFKSAFGKCEKHVSIRSCALNGPRCFSVEDGLIALILHPAGKVYRGRTVDVIGQKEDKGVNPPLSDAGALQLSGCPVGCTDERDSMGFRQI
jgi:hypothetical protein